MSIHHHIHGHTFNILLERLAHQKNINIKTEKNLKDKPSLQHAWLKYWRNKRLKPDIFGDLNIYNKMMIASPRRFIDIWNSHVWQFHSISELNPRRNLKISQPLNSFHLKVVTKLLLQTWTRNLKLLRTKNFRQFYVWK